MITAHPQPAPGEHDRTSGERDRDSGQRPPGPGLARPRSLLTQVLAVNLLPIAAAIVFGTIAAAGRGTALTQARALVVFGLATVAILAGNWLLLRHRFAPLEQLIATMESVDLADAQDGARKPPALEQGSEEVERLGAAFARMMARLEAERRAAGRSAIEAQERERRRIAHDLHDEVNQALTAVSLRLQASIEHAPFELAQELEETKRLSAAAMRELLALARQLRPAVLDDHGLLAALRSQVRDFSEQSRIAARLRVHGAQPELSDEQQLAIYRVLQESLSNVARHAQARSVEVQLHFGRPTALRVRDDGCGFDGSPRPGGLGLPGMRERALLAGGRLVVHSAAGRGTIVELTIR
jgi:two-component system sensor histidine kinase UhpB